MISVIVPGISNFWIAPMRLQANHWHDGHNAKDRVTYEQARILDQRSMAGIRVRRANVGVIEHDVVLQGSFLSPFQRYQASPSTILTSRSAPSPRATRASRYWLLS